MKKTKIDNDKIREQIKQGLDLSFKKLLQQKRQTNSFLLFSENGTIKKVKASDIKD